MTTPPRTAELILESLCAPTSFHDACPGDMAEEYAARVERNGQRDARLWYYREVARSAPHLLFVWLRSLRISEAKRLGGVLLASFVFALVLGSLAIALVVRVGDVIGLFPRAPGAPVIFPIWVMIPLAVLCATLAGYIAAWLNEREPLPTAAALGLVWSSTGIAVGVLTRNSGVPVWIPSLLAIVTAIGPLAGGILRIRVRHTSRRKTRTNTPARFT